MTSIPLFFDSRKGSGKSENFTISFNPPIQLDIKKRYEISLINAQIWYSWHNISDHNNKLFYIPGGTTSKLLEYHLEIITLRISMMK